jgi:hypothetical protein
MSNAFGEQIIQDLQDDVYNRLLEDPFLAEVSVHNERKGEILDGIVKSLGTFNARGGKIGAAIVVLAPSASAEYSEMIDSPMSIGTSVRVLEAPIFNSGENGTGLSALVIARRIYRIFHLYTPHGLSTPFIPGSPTIFPVDDPVAPLAYEVRFQATEAGYDLAPKVNTPTIQPWSNDGTPVPVAEVGVECATEGASVYYTTDGSHPGPGNVNSTLATAPFSVTQPLKVRAAAFKTGSLPSDVQMSVFTEPVV